jgi:hypothetical protein
LRRLRDILLSDVMSQRQTGHPATQNDHIEIGRLVHEDKSGGEATLI